MTFEEKNIVFLCRNEFLFYNFLIAVYVRRMSGLPCPAVCRTLLSEISFPLLQHPVGMFARRCGRPSTLVVSSNWCLDVKCLQCMTLTDLQTFHPEPITDSDWNVPASVCNSLSICLCYFLSVVSVHLSVCPCPAGRFFLIHPVVPRIYFAMTKL